MAEEAARKEWESVKSDLDVFRHSGEKVTEDPRRTPEYQKLVVDGLGLTKESKPHLSQPDLDAIKEMIERKAAAFWVEGTPRTTVRYFQHDTIPTGPPCRLPPHNLKGEQAEWVDQKLDEEVQRGQCVRGNSAWGSPAFPTKEFAEHRRQRKRRIVVDYRRVNARTLRAVYYVRRSDDVKAEAAGSIFLTFLDAVTGFNQLVNTPRARQMLAIIALSLIHI